MEHLTSVFLVTGLFLLGVISPGPNFLIVTQQSLGKGHRAGIATGLGIAFGDLLYASAGLFGLAAIIATAGWLFGTIKLLGGIYLIFLGIKMLKTKTAVQNKTEEGPASYSFVACFRLGLLTDLANPKTVIFFTSIFASTINSDTPHWVLACMLAGIVFTSILWRTGLSFLFSRDLFKGVYIKFRGWIEKTFGALLIFFGLKLTYSVLVQNK